MTRYEAIERWAGVPTSELRVFLIDFLATGDDDHDMHLAVRLGSMNRLELMNEAWDLCHDAADADATASHVMLIAGR